MLTLLHAGTVKLTACCAPLATLAHLGRRCGVRSNDHAATLPSEWSGNHENARRFARWHTLCSNAHVVTIPRAFLFLVARVPAWLTLGLALAVTSPAFGQAISLKSQSYRVERANERSSSEEPYAINRQDCLDDDPTKPDYDYKDAPNGRTWIRFTIYVDGNIKNNSRLEIWVSQGADCTDQDERKPGGRCTQVYKNPKADTIQLSDVAHVYPRIAVGDTNIEDMDLTDVDAYPGTEVCDEPIDQAYTFYIMLFEGDTVASNVKWTDTRVDLLGPDPPTEISAKVGESSAYVSWEIPSEQEDPDTQGFALYCAPASADGGMGGAGGAGACGSVLVAGELPPGGKQYECGTVTGRGTREGTARNLENGTTYAVAVAARDLVMNSGVLSEADCVTPEEVTTFFESYKQSGGRGGGGYCAQSPRPVGPAGLLLLLILGTTAWVRRRQRGAVAGEHS